MELNNSICVCYLFYLHLMYKLNTMKREDIKNLINKYDEVYLVLRNELGYLHPDVQYMKGQRDACLNIYNKLAE